MYVRGLVMGVCVTPPPPPPPSRDGASAVVPDLLNLPGTGLVISAALILPPQSKPISPIGSTHPQQ